VRQEIWFRQRVYANKVQAGKMPQAEMDEKIRVMREVMESLAELQAIRKGQQSRFGESTHG
jgi:hypothetical protein